MNKITENTTSWIENDKGEYFSKVRKAEGSTWSGWGGVTEKGERMVRTKKEALEILKGNVD